MPAMLDLETAAREWIEARKTYAACSTAAREAGERRNLAGELLREKEAQLVRIADPEHARLVRVGEHALCVTADGVTEMQAT